MVSIKFDFCVKEGHAKDQKKKILYWKEHFFTLFRGWLHKFQDSFTIISSLTSVPQVSCPRGTC
jgi:hypothetical protein